MGIYPLVIQHSNEQSQPLMGNSTNSMIIFNSYVELPEGIIMKIDLTQQTGFHWIGLETQKSTYLLVNVYITMEHHHVIAGKSH